MNYVHKMNQKSGLIGRRTEWFTDRNLKCKISLNTDTNINRGKGQPIMLEDVDSTDQSVPSPYNNVVVCEDGTPIKFRIVVSGHNVFGYSVKPDRGIPVVEESYTLTENKNETRSLGFTLDKHKYGDVIIIGTSELRDEAYEHLYQRYVVKVWRVDSLVKDGRPISLSPCCGRRAKRLIENVVEDHHDILGMLYINFVMVKSLNAVRMVGDKLVVRDFWPSPV